MRIIMAGMGILACFVVGCGSDPLPGRDGTQGLPGRDGVQGPDGTLGAVGVAGSQGAVGAVGPKGNPGLGGPVDGSRLKAMYRKGEDGSRDYTGSWWDSMLAVECSYQRASDGVERCLPAMLGITKTTTAASAFLDAACTKPYVYYTTSSAGCQLGIDPGYGSKIDADCGTSIHVYQLGPAVELAPVYVIVGQVCQPVGPFAAGYLTQEILAEVPAASFVGATGTHD